MTLQIAFRFVPEMLLTRSVFVRGRGMNFRRGLWADLPKKRGQWLSESLFVGPKIRIDE